MFKCAALFFHYVPLHFPIFCFSLSCCYSVIVIILHWMSSISESSGKFHIFCFVCFFFFHYFLYWNKMKCLPNQRMPKAKDNDRFVWFLKRLTNGGLVCIANCQSSIDNNAYSLVILYTQFNVCILYTAHTYTHLTAELIQWFFCLLFRYWHCWWLVPTVEFRLYISHYFTNPWHYIICTNEQSNASTNLLPFEI